MGGPTPPYARMAADISDSSTSGRSVLTGTATQGATALGLGTGNTPTFTGVRTVSASDITAFSSAAGAGTLAYTTAGTNSYLWNGGTNLYFGTNTSNDLIIGTNNTERARVTSSGDWIMANAGRMRLGASTVAALTASTVGDLLYVSNGRKIGEAAGAGTGVVAVYTNGAWRRLSDDTVVAA